MGAPPPHASLCLLIFRWLTFCIIARGSCPVREADADVKDPANEISSGQENIEGAGCDPRENKIKKTRAKTAAGKSTLSARGGRLFSTGSSDDLIKLSHVRWHRKMGGASELFVAQTRTARGAGVSRVLFTADAFVPCARSRYPIARKGTKLEKCSQTSPTNPAAPKNLTCKTWKIHTKTECFPYIIIF